MWLPLSARRSWHAALEPLTAVSQHHLQERRFRASYPVVMIQPGLQRIAKLLKNVRFPWKAIHVAGTNGKGSICHYASSLLTSRGIKHGKFTSPHLVDRWDCISINDTAIDETTFRQVEDHYTRLNLREEINASNFEILTATAFHIFNDRQVEVGVVEVGMGGELDATNILNNQTVSVIAKIARDHETFLGNSLAGIAKHKAGILRPNVPYIIHPLNEPNVQHVIKQCATEIGAGPLLTGKSKDMRNLAYRDTWHRFAKPLLPFQRENAVLAVVAVKEVIKSLGLEYDNAKIGSALVERMWKPNPGRLQHTRVEPVFDEPKGRRILVDGAHNPDAAKALRDYVWKHERRKPIKGLSTPRDGWPVTWVLAMTEGKDARQYLETLLAPEDNVVTTSFGPVDGMPWVKAMDPKQLLDVARSVYPEITGIHIPEASPLRALCAAKHLAYNDKPIVLTGSLYLIGDFHRDLRAWRDRKRRSEFEIEEREPLIREMEKMDKEERSRVNQVLSLQDPDASVQITDTGNIVEESRKRDFRERRRLLQEELDAVNQEIARLRDEQSERMMHAPFSSPEIATTQTPKIGKPNKPAFRIRKHMTVLHPDLTMHAPFSKTRKLKKGTVRIRTHLTGNEKLPVIRQIDTELTAETRARVMSYRALSDLRTAS